MASVHHNGVGLRVLSVAIGTKEAFVGRIRSAHFNAKGERFYHVLCPKGGLWHRVPNDLTFFPPVTEAE